MRFRGQLLIPAEGGPGLSVDLEVENQQLAVVSDSETLGIWPLESVNVRRLAGDKFAMRVAGEDLHFVADDTISFAYDGIEAIERPRPGARAGKAMLRGLKGLLGLDEDHRVAAPTGSLTANSGGVPATMPDIGDVATPEPSNDLAEVMMTPWDIPEDVVDSRPTDVLADLPGIEAHEFVDQPDVGDPLAGLAKTTLPPATPADLDAHPPTDTCKALRADGQPCESPIVGATGYCYPHDPTNPVAKTVRDAHEARRSLRHERAERLGRVYSKLDKALRKVERGEMDTEQAMAMAQLARTMCAILELGDDGADDLDGDSPAG